jgi:phosphate ABC transporter phosphate-binding protein
VFVAPQNTAGSTDAVRRRLIESLEKNSGLRVVTDEKTADAILRVTTVIWPTGTVSVNPRSKSATSTNYQGYASAELSDKSNQTLWSYLATPSRFRFASIADDLAGQLSASLLAAAKNGFTATTASLPSSNRAGPTLRAAGATFPAPLYLKWFESFRQQPGGFPITYDAVGSVSGLEQLTSGKIDIAASDIPGETTKTNILRLPTVVGGVVPIYNLSSTGNELNLTPELLADIYSGKISKWNDPRIRQWNKSAHLPDAAITVVHRVDGSGTTFVWTSYLAEASPEWKARIGADIEWPTGVGATGSQGVAEQVAATKNAIGYVELTYAIQHQLNYARVRNPAGRFIKADLASLTAAVVSAKTAGQDPSESLLNASGQDAYPIATFTYFLVRQSGGNTQERAALSGFLHWMLTSGQKQCSSLGYAPLPRVIINEEMQTLSAWK